jgi:hypothetical protein
VNTRRRFLKIVSGTAGGFAFGSPPGAEARQSTVTILHGHGAPPRRRGIGGDFYIDTNVHVIYGPKSAEGWGRPTSLVGPRGRTGTRGAAGAAGSNGYAVLNGPEAPAATIGVDNDFYVDTETTQLYGPKQGGVWGSPISLTGGANIALIDGGSL